MMVTLEVLLTSMCLMHQRLIIFNASKPRSRHRAYGEGWWVILDGKYSNISSSKMDEKSMNNNKGDETWCTNPSTFFKIPSQISQIGAQKRSEGNLASASAKCLSHFLEKCYHLWAVLGFSWAPGGSPNPSFGTKFSQHLKKWHPEWGIRKNENCWLHFHLKKWKFECAERTGMLYIKAFRWLALIMIRSNIPLKNTAEKVPNMQRAL